MLHLVGCTTSHLRHTYKTACDSQGVAVEGKSSSVWVGERPEEG